MKNIRHEIGSLTALSAFEAAGRLGSFTLAARELGVSQAAVSKQVALLEDNLGVLLFRRTHRSIALTDGGNDLFATVTDSFSLLGGTLKRLKSPAEFRPVTIAATKTMANLWLLPKLQSFKALYPDIAIRVLSQDEPVDLYSGVAQIAVRFGSGNWSDGEVTPLFRRAVRAMASPVFLNGRDILLTPDDVLRCPLIAYDTLDTTWPNWPDWLRAAGLRGRSVAPTLSFSNYLDAFRAASDHQGILLAWVGLDARMEEAQDFVPVPGPVIRTAGEFYLVRSANTPDMPEAALLFDWLLNKGARRTTADQRAWTPLD